MSAHAFFVVFELLLVRRHAAFGHWNSVDDGGANASAHNVVLQMTTAAAAEPAAINRCLGRQRRCLGMFVMVRIAQRRCKRVKGALPLKVVSFFSSIIPSTPKPSICLPPSSRGLQFPVRILLTSDKAAAAADSAGTGHAYRGDPSPWLVVSSYVARPCYHSSGIDRRERKRKHAVRPKIFLL